MPVSTRTRPPAARQPPPKRELGHHTGREAPGQSPADLSGLSPGRGLAGRLTDAPWAGAQRRILAAQIGQAHGNGHLRRLLAAGPAGGGLQRQPDQLRRAKKRPPKPAQPPALDAAADFTKAQAYVTDFYTLQAAIVADLYQAAVKAIHNFGIRSGIADDQEGQFPIEAIKAVLKHIPGAGQVLEALEYAETGLAIGKEVGVDVLASEKAPGSQEETAKALDKAFVSYAELRKSVFDRQALHRGMLNVLHDSSWWRQMPGFGGPLLEIMRRVLGPIPVYDPEVLKVFGDEYELRLYKDFYVRNAWVAHLPPDFFAVPVTQYKIHQVPAAVQTRLVELYKRLGRTAAVSIDTQYFDGHYTRNPDDPAVVRILLDLGVKLYNPYTRDKLIDSPESLHTGDDLRQPYKGPRHKEVK